MEKIPEPVGVPAETEEQFDLKRLLLALYSRAWILAVVTVVVMTADVIYTHSMPTLYKATTQIMIEIPSASASVAKEAQTTSIGQADYFTSQYEIIKSKAVAQRVVKALDLTTLPEFKDGSPETIFQQMITVQPIRNSRLVNISVEYRNPVLAAKMADALAQAYIEQNRESMMFMSQEILKLIPDETQEANAAAGQEKTQTGDQEKKTDIELLPSIVGNPMLQGLKLEKAKINSEIATLSKRYKEKHPKMIAARTRLKTTNDQITEQTKNVLLTVKADLGGSLRANNIRIVDKAEVPRRPSSPDKPKNMLLGLLFSLLMGGGIIYLLEKMDDTVKTQEDIQKHLRLPFFGDFPFVKTISKLPNTIEKFEKIDKDLHASTAIREIRTGLTFAVHKTTSHTITITSAVPKEGKSFFAAYLAYSFAKNGVKTLLIDADLRVPTLHQTFSIPQSPGLGNLLSEGVAPDAAIVPTSLPNLFILPAGATRSDPSELFDTPKMREVIDALSKEFGKIIVDAPPSLLIPDAMVLSKVTDGTLLVIRSGLLQAKALMEIRDKFEVIGSTMMGFVLNAARFGKHKYYDQHYKHYYHNAAAVKHRKSKLLGVKTPPPTA